MEESPRFTGRFPPPRKVRVREKGQFTIPAEFRSRMGIKDDTVLNVYQVGKAIIATPAAPSVRELAEQVEYDLKSNKLRLEDLLNELREGSHDYEEDD